MTYATQYLSDFSDLCEQINPELLDLMADLLNAVRDRGGRLFFLGVGGSAANCSHAVNDFRKIAKIESYAPTDNVAEFSARMNDDSWTETFTGYLAGSHLSRKDAIFVLSVGGGTPTASANITAACAMANEVGATILGIVSRDGGFTMQIADACILIPTIREATITPYAESMQAVLWHLLVNHPLLY